MALARSAAIYAWTAGMVGGANLAAGVGSYGLASFACPWWPTGLGGFGGLAAAGQAAVHVGYLWYLNRQMLASSATPLQKIKSMLPTRFWTSPVLLPVMWASVAICGFLIR